MMGVMLNVRFEQRSNRFRILNGFGGLGTRRETNTSEVEKRQRRCARRGDTQPFRLRVSDHKVDPHRAAPFLHTRYTAAPNRQRDPTSL